MAALRIDLNADVGESFGAYCLGQDAALMRSITSANIAAGLHAGDPSVLRQTVRLAKAHGVAVGAHPGYPDLAGFGRRIMQMTPAEVEDIVLYQVAVVAGVAAAEGLKLQHVKPHGALYATGSRDGSVAAALVTAVRAFDATLLIFGPGASALERAAALQGMRFIREGFADRAYGRDGYIVPRDAPGAVLGDVARAASQAVELVRDHRVTAVDGRHVNVVVETLCVHGDTPGAGLLAADVRARLTATGIEVKCIGARD